MTLQPHSLAAAVAVALLGTSGAAFSTNLGTSPAAGPVINPLTGQETQVWKLVGKSAGCSATQITREWIMATHHCPPNNNVGGGFVSALGTSGVMTSTCESAPARKDFKLCRLSTPSAMTVPASYPPLVIDAEAGLTRFNANKLGLLMAYGRSAPNLLTFVSLDGLPHGFEPAVNPSGSQIPYAVGGDSGGGSYWFSSTASQPALAGIIQGGGNITVPQGTGFFTAEQTDWIVARISQYGDVPPSVITAAQHFTGPAGDTAPELGAPPAFQGSGYNWTAAWQTPSPGAVTAYKVSVGKNGTLDRSFSVAAGTGNTANLSALSAEKYRICVRPQNALGPAPAVKSIAFEDFAPWAVTGITTPNCATLDMRLPTSVGTLNAAKTYTAATGLYRITATWSVPAAPELTPKYRVAQTLTYANGASRTSAATVTSPTYSATNLQAGSQVCLTVTGYSRADVLGTPSSVQCFTAN